MSAKVALVIVFAEASRSVESVSGATGKIPYAGVTTCVCVNIQFNTAGIFISIKEKDHRRKGQLKDQSKIAAIFSGTHSRLTLLLVPLNEKKMLLPSVLSHR